MLIPKTNFYLKNLKATEPTLISVQIKFNLERVFLSTGEKVHPKEWDFAKHRAICNKKTANNNDLNFWLDKIEAESKNIFREFNINGVTPKAQQIKGLLETRLNLVAPVKVANKCDTLFTFLEQLIPQQANSKSQSTVKSYKTTLNHLKEFGLSQSKKDYSFEEINVDFYNAYVSFLYSKYSLSKNSAGKDIKVLKTLLGEASDRGLNQNFFYRSKLFKKPNEKVDKIYLSESEIKKINSLRFEKKGAIETVRDLFVIACYSGLRFSDFSTLSKENFTDEYIIKIARKTRKKVIIPIHPVVKEILKKYDSDFPRPLSNQKMNDHLKTIARKAGLDTQIEVIKSNGGTASYHMIEKCDLVSTHTGRRSFATNAYLAGVPAISIMKITGHKTEKAFLSYICIDELENAEHIRMHDFFNNANFKAA
jgi:site-specific recombinase XerD